MKKLSSFLFILFFSSVLFITFGFSSLTPDKDKDFNDTVKGVVFVMKAIPAGSMEIGCKEGRDYPDCDYDEKPVHNVSVDAMWVAETEVTQALWKAVMDHNPSYFANCDSCPVEFISWNDIQLFLEKLNAITKKKYRMLSEEEWEYAARGGEHAKYGGGDNVELVAWYGDNSKDKTHPVKMKKSNAFGLYDMNGNVWEWTSTAAAAYEGGGMDDCTGCYMLRGGSWDSSKRSVSNANRDADMPGSRGSSNGFRLALSGASK